MKKPKKLLLIFSTAVCALLLVLCCTSCKTEEKKHNWDWDYDADGHWQYCVDEDCDEKTEKVAHVDANGDEICDDCKASLKKAEPPAPVEKTETAIIYFHKPADFGDKVYAHAYYHDSESNSDKNLTGEEKSYEVTTIEDGWYKIEVKHPEGLLKTGSFSLKLSLAEGSSINLTIHKSEMWVSAKGNLFATKAEALKDEEPPVIVEKNEYTIYMYAPNAETVSASVLDLEKASLESVGGHENWFSYTFKTDKEITDGFNLSFYLGDTTELSRNTNSKDKIYFIAVGDGTGYTSFELAEAAYEQITHPEEKVTITIHVHKIAEWEDIYGHAFIDDTEAGVLTGEFGSTKGILDSDNAGWYTFAIEVGESVVAEDGSGFTLMVYDERPGSAREELNIEGIKSDCWVAYDGTAYETKEAAEEYEATLQPVVKVEYAIYYYAPDWAENEAVYVYTFDGLSVGGYHTKMLADEESGWYKLTFKTADEFSSFGIIFHTNDEEIIKHEFDVTLTEELLEGRVFYFIGNDDAIFANKQAAEAQYEENNKVEYTIYMYAPAAETVSATVLDLDKVSLESVADHNGWYSLTFKTAKDISDGFNLSFYLDEDETELSRNTNSKDKVYFIAVGEEAGYTSFELAEAAYEKITEVKVTVTIYVHKIAEWEDIYGHAYVTADHILSGAFGSLKGTLDSDNAGWYTFAIEVGESVVAEDGSGFTLMVYDERPGSAREELKIEGIKSDCWVAYDGTAYETKEAAEEYEATLQPVVKVEYTIYYYAPDWAEGEAVYVYTFDGPSVGGYHTEMIADEDTGWYKVTFKTEEEFSGFGIIFHTNDEEIIKHEFNATLSEELLEGKAFYFIDNSDDIYASKEAAEAQYEENVRLEEKVTITIHVHKVAEWEELYGHAYTSQDVVLTGAFGSTKGVADSDNTGWFTFAIEVANKELTEDALGFTLMLFDILPETGRNELKIYKIKNDCWVTYSGQAYETLEEALEAEANATLPTTQTVKIHYHSTSEGNTVHAFYNNGVEDIAFTDWNTKPAMTVDLENEDWLVVELEVLENLFDDYGHYSAIIVDVNGVEHRIEGISSAEAWVSGKYNLFATKEEALVDDHVHSYDDTYVYIKDEVADPDFHWQLCLGCGEESEKELHEYEEGSLICVKCGYEKPAPSHDHVWSEEYDTSIEGFHKQVCTVEGCVETNIQAHEFGDWIIDSEGQFGGEQGSRHKDCTVCGSRIDNSFDALPVLYLRGDINGWGDGEQWKLVADYDAGTLTISGVTFDEAGKGWKLASSDWDTQAHAGNLDADARNYFGGVDWDNIIVNVTGTYTIILNVHGGWTLSVIKTA